MVVVVPTSMVAEDAAGFEVAVDEVVVDEVAALEAAVAS